MIMIHTELGHVSKKQNNTADLRQGQASKLWTMLNAAHKAKERATLVTTKDEFAKRRGHRYINTAAIQKKA